MKTTFSKSQIIILTTLGLIGTTFIVIPIINHSDEYLMPTIALISWFLFGIYFNYLKNKRFDGKGSEIFLLYNLKQANIVNLVIVLGLIGVIIVASVNNFSFYGLFIMIGVLLFISLIMILFPYRNGFLIMIGKTVFYSYETGFVKWEMITKYKFRTDSMLIDIELKNDETKSLKYNKFLDIELFKKELGMKFHS